MLVVSYGEEVEAKETDSSEITLRQVNENCFSCAFKKSNNTEVEC